VLFASCSYFITHFLLEFIYEFCIEKKSIILFVQYMHAVNYSSLKENLNLHKSVLADHNYKITRISRENCNCATLLSGDGKSY